LPAQDGTDRVRNISGGKSSRRDLIEQRLKEMMIATIDQRYLNILAAQSLRRIEPTESTANDYNPRTASRLHEEIITGVDRCDRRESVSSANDWRNPFIYMF